LDDKDDPDEPSFPPKGGLVVDATCAPADIRYPTDVSNPPAWAESDRIQSKDGIPEGTFIVKIEGNTFTIGSAVMATKSALFLDMATFPESVMD
jgi:hypothetical protein